MLSIEQMKHLQEMGLDLSNADMYWFLGNNGKEVGIKGNHTFDINTNVKGEEQWYLDIDRCHIIPTYSLLVLINKLPKYIDKYGKKYELCIIPMPCKNGWSISYTSYDDNGNSTSTLNWVVSDIETAAYEMLCWCLVNGHIDYKNK